MPECNFKFPPGCGRNSCAATKPRVCLEKERQCYQRATLHFRVLTSQFLDAHDSEKDPPDDCGFHPPPHFFGPKKFLGKLNSVLEVPMLGRTTLLLSAIFLASSCLLHAENRVL